MPVKQVHILLSGRVQGVGFRYFACHQAEELHILGWVKNTRDGRVEIEASGETQQVDTFIFRMKTGPARAMVTTVTVSNLSPERTFTSFTIR